MAKRGLGKGNRYSSNEGDFLSSEQNLEGINQTSSENEIQFSHQVEPNTLGDENSDLLHISEINSISTKPTSKISKGVSLSALLISAAAAGTSIIGAASIMGAKGVDVSLFQSDPESLVFEINKRNLEESDLLISSLSYQGQIIEESEIHDGRFLSYNGLSLENQYCLTIQLYENYYVKDEQLNREQIAPKTLHEALYRTSPSSQESYIEIYEHDRGGLSFEVINGSSYSFLTTRVYTDKVSLLTDDFSGESKKYELKEIPKSDYIYITVQYRDTGVAFCALEPIMGAQYKVSFDPNGGSGQMDSYYVIENEPMILPSCDYVAPEGKEFAYWSINGVKYEVGAEVTIYEDTMIMAIWQDISNVSVSLSESMSSISYDSLYLAYEVQNAESSTDLKVYFAGEQINDVSLVDGVLYIEKENLEPETEYKVEIFDGDKRLYLENIKTDYIVNLTSNGGLLEISFSDSFYQRNQDNSNLLYRVVFNDEILLVNEMGEQSYEWEGDIFTGVYTFVLFTYGEEVTSQEETILYSKDFSLVGLNYRIELLSSSITYDSINALFKLFDVSYSSDFKVLFDGKAVSTSEYRIADNGNFTIYEDELEEDHDYLLEIYDSNTNLLFSETFHTDYTVNLVKDSNSQLSLSFSDSYYLTLGGDQDAYYSIRDSLGYVIHSNSIDAQTETITDLTLYSGDYIFSLYDGSDVTDEPTPILTKTFTLVGLQRPEFTFEVQNHVVEITYVSGDLPVGEDEDNTSYVLAIYTEDASYNVSYRSLKISASNPVVYFDLAMGEVASSFEGSAQPGTSASYDAESGEYVVTMSYGNVFYRGSFTVNS